MIQRTETLLAENPDTSLNLLIAMAAFENLGWNVKYATNTSVIAHTPRKWNKWNDEVTVEISGNEVSITSRLIHNEAFDLMGKNKKHIRDFKLSFEEMNKAITEDRLGELRHKLEIIKEETVKKAEHEIEQATKLDEAMNISKGNQYLTYTIIGLNVLMFIITIASGVSIMSPTGGDLLPFGANYAPVTAEGEWWRLLTSTFLHFGILHLALNMYALFMVGVYLEPMLGKVRYGSAYVCTGILASLASFIWHKADPVVSAGASGAVFGMYGVFVALLTTSLIPRHVRGQLLQSIGIFVAYNIIYGLKPNSGIDNAAHLGGLISGLIIGYIYYFSIKANRQSKSVVVPALLVMLTAVTVYLVMTRIPQNDAQRFSKSLQEFGRYEEDALQPLRDNKVDTATLRTITLANWRNAERVTKEMEDYNVKPIQERSVELLREYVSLRITQTELFIKSEAESTNAYETEIIEIQDKINKVTEELKQVNSSN